MSTQRDRTPLEAVQALESGAFRVGQVMRRVLAEHPDLSIRRFNPSVDVYAYFDEEAEATAKVEIGARGVDGVHAWADALGGEASVRINSHGGSIPYEYAKVTTTLDGVVVEIVGTRRLSDEEAAAWQAEQDQAAEDTTGGGR